MPRHGRIIVPGIPVHAIQRGNNRVACFHDDADRSFFAQHLGRLLREEGCALHAYCLMTNHVHLLLTPEQADGCGRLFKRLGVLHTQYTNRRYERTGTLWEGRFRSCLVQSERYLIACQRYIELNPVRLCPGNRGLPERNSSKNRPAGDEGAAWKTIASNLKRGDGA